MPLRNLLLRPFENSAKPTHPLTQKRITTTSYEEQEKKFLRILQNKTKLYIYIYIKKKAKYIKKNNHNNCQLQNPEFQVCVDSPFNKWRKNQDWIEENKCVMI